MSIVSQKILRDSSGVSRGVGFIRFETRDDAVRAIEKFNGLTLPGGTAPLQVRFSDSPAQKKLKVAAAQRRRAMKHGPPVPAQGVFGRRQSAEGGYYPGGFYLPYPPLPVPVVPEYAWPVPMPYPPAFAEDGARLGVGGYEVRAPRSPSDLGASAEASAGSEDEGYEVVDGGEEELAAMVGGMRIGGEVAGAYAEDADADAVRGDGDADR
ncbi:hypothetical protein DFJ74DRAFT_321286 [Hyaloraphidium curvatum]|nr:hypothetical protein DFJ74DRAFT_321286 [Hyaloraphidium curvatum]